MWDSINVSAFQVMLVLVFVAVLLLLEGSFLLWKSNRSSEARKIGKRLHSLSSATRLNAKAQVLKDRVLSDVPAFEQWLSSVPRAQRLHKTLLQAGIGWTVSRLLLTSLALGFVGFMATFSIAHQSVLISLAIGSLLTSLPVAYVGYKRGRRLETLERQLPEALDYICRALRSGHAFTAALLMAGEEMAEPIAGEFKIVHDEINFGVSMQQALTNLSDRVPLTDLRYFVVSVLIQRESGGNLTEVLSNLSRLVRERLKLFAKVRVLSANGRFSAWTLVILPFALGGIMAIMNPAFMTPLWTDPIGTTILKIMLTLMFCGVIMMRMIIKIRV